MTSDFAGVLQGLMQNRRLSNRVISRASGRAESTINRLVMGLLEPNPEILWDIAPVLQIDVADLLVIAGLPVEPVTGRRGPYQATREIGTLVAVSSWLAPAQVEQLIQAARDLREVAKED